MGIPIVAGDVSTPFTSPSAPPVFVPATMLSGTAKVFFGGKSVMVVGAAQTSLGAIATSSLVTVKTFIEGAPGHLAGSLCTTTSGWTNGTLQGTTPNIQVT
jgi:hypothetical protein